MKNIRTRFAPSPTGYMHIGNLRTALYAYLVAKKDPNGVFMLRIEDTDQNRQVEGATEIIYETLKQCHLYHDEGPDVGGQYGPYIQSERKKLGLYLKHALELVEKKKAHLCFCHEQDIQNQRDIASARNESFIFNDPCKKLSADEIKDKLDSGAKYVIRQHIDPEGETSFEDEVYGTITVNNSTLDEMVLIKSDGFPTYNFANVIDDHLMNITHVVRGNEYLSSTPKYNLIYQAFGWDIPKYIHCPPVMKDEQNKLSKRNGDASFQDLIAKGYLAPAILNYIALLGWSPSDEREIFSLEELCQAFDVKHIGTSGAIFDIEKLKWMNGVYLRNMSDDDYYQLVLPYINKVVKKNYDTKEIARILKERVVLLNDIYEMIDFFDDVAEYDIELYSNKKMKTDPNISLNSLKELEKILSQTNDYSHDSIHQLLMQCASDLGLKNGQLLYPLRVALSGKAFTPGGAIDICAILKKDETLKRIKTAIDKLQNVLGNQLQ